MSPMTDSLRDAVGALRRNWGLAIFVLLANLGLAAVLAKPLAGAIERDLEHTEASVDMMYGFDHGWWKEWSERQTGWTKNFGPDLLGNGFAAKSLDSLLKGQLPLGLFARVGDQEPGGEPPPPPALDPVILALGAAYLLAQTFLTGGLLGVFRSPEGGWTVRGLLHGSGFYAGRLVRVMLLALAVAAVVFWLHAPLTGWMDERARESVSETGALAWSLGRHALLLGALVLVHMVSSFAKVIVVVEERSSAVLAFLSSITFCVRNVGRTLGQYLVVGVGGLALLLVWRVLDGAVEVTGYKTQLLFLLLAQAFVLGRIKLRLLLLAAQVALYRRRVAPGVG
jgi:hypothetical protein